MQISELHNLHYYVLVDLKIKPILNNILSIELLTLQARGIRLYGARGPQ